MKRTMLVTGCVALGVAIAAFSLNGLKAQAASTEAPTALVETYEVMEMFFEPHFDSLKATVAKAPESRKEWKALYTGAYALAEASNLLYFRSEEDYVKAPEWATMTTAARDAAVAMAEAVKKQDYDAIKAAWVTTVQSCNACHEHFEPDDGPETLEP